jgi:hypothetical protein
LEMGSSGPLRSVSGGEKEVFNAELPGKAQTAHRAQKRVAQIHIKIGDAGWNVGVGGQMPKLADALRALPGRELRAQMAGQALAIVRLGQVGGQQLELGVRQRGGQVGAQSA